MSTGEPILRDRSLQYRSLLEFVEDSLDAHLLLIMMIVSFF